MKSGTLTAILGAFALSLALSAAPTAFAQEPSQQVEMKDMITVDYDAILSAADRSDADKERDPWRHPADVLKIMKVMPGQMILDVGAGSGYYSEVFARAVGPTGMVHAINYPDTVERFPAVVDNLAARKEALKSGRIIPEVSKLEELTAHKPADAVFMGLMYHEVIRNNMDANAVNTAIFNALRAGGLYVIEIHNAKAGAGREVSETFHRADPDIVRSEVLAAGFELVEENTELFANPDDPLDILVFDPSVRFKTARTLFVFKRR